MKVNNLSPYWSKDINLTKGFAIGTIASALTCVAGLGILKAAKFELSKLSFPLKGTLAISSLGVGAAAMHFTHVHPVVYSAIHPSEGEHPIDKMMVVAKDILDNVGSKNVDDGELFDHLSDLYKDLEENRESTKEKYNNSFLVRQTINREFNKRVEQFKDFL